MKMNNRQNKQSKRMVVLGVVAIILLMLCFILFLKKPVSFGKGQNEPVTVQGFKLNTSVQISVYDEVDESVLQEALDLCDQYERIFSRTMEESEIYQLNHGLLPQEDGWYVLSDECAALIRQGLYYSELSRGAFDITIEPVSSLWNFTSEEHVVPGIDEIEQALKKVGYDKVELQGNRIRFEEEGMGIELGAIAKGYIADQIKAFLKSKGVEHAIIDLGGNVLCLGERPDGEPFRVGIQKPFAKRSETVATTTVKDRSVVSSGIYERYFEKDGKLYHHILNPKSGMPYENELLSVSILSDASVDGDALSTTCYALGLEQGMELINQLPDVQAVFITKDGELHYSADFPL